MKKVSLIGLLLILMITLTACSGGNTIPLTEEESDGIAQYCAYLLMKYDSNHRANFKLLDMNDLKKEVAEREKQAQKEAERHKPTATPAPEPTEAPEPSTNPGVDNPSDPGASPAEEDNNGIPSSDAASIADTADISGFSIDYVGYQLVDSYATEDDYYSFSAPEGKKLCVVSFSVTNTSTETAKFDAISYKLGYNLTCTDGAKHKSEISLLADDIQFYNSDIAAGESGHATLMFYVNPEEEPFYLEIKGIKTYIVTLNQNPEVDYGN